MLSLLQSFDHADHLDRYVAILEDRISIVDDLRQAASLTVDELEEIADRCVEIVDVVQALEIHCAREARAKRRMGQEEEEAVPVGAR